MDQVSTPTGWKPIWGTSTISGLLRNEAYIGRLSFNRTETVPSTAKKGHPNQVRLGVNGGIDMFMEPNSRLCWSKH